MLAAFPGAAVRATAAGALAADRWLWLFAFALQFTFLFAGMRGRMPTGLSSLVIQVQAFFTIALVALLMPRTAATAAGAWRPRRRRGLVLSHGTFRRDGAGIRTGHRRGPRLGHRQTSSSSAYRAITRWLSSSGQRGSRHSARDRDACHRSVSRSVRIVASCRRETGSALHSSLATTLVAFGIWAWLLRASCRRGCAVHAAGSDRRHELRCMVARRTGDVVELAGAALVLAGSDSMCWRHVGAESPSVDPMARASSLRRAWNRPVAPPRPRYRTAPKTPFKRGSAARGRRDGRPRHRSRSSSVSSG